MELRASWEAASCAATQELPNILWNPKLHHVFTRALHLFRSWARSIQSIPPHPISLESTLILSTHLRFHRPSVSFLLAFPPISYMHSSSPHSCYLPRPSHPLWSDHSDYTWRTVKFMMLLIVQFSPPFRHFISLLSTYSPQHPVLKHPQSRFLP
jgi:hypothetical protein